MKKFFLFALAMAMTMAASAQITRNAKAGGGFAFCSGTNEDGDTKSKPVGKIGAGFEYPLTANFSVMPSLEFAMKGTKWTGSDEIYYEGYWFDVDIEETISILYVQMPIVGAYRLNLNDDWNLVAKAGPYFAFGIKGDCKIKASIDDVSDSEKYDFFEDEDGKRFDVGIDAGLDFEYHRFVIGFEYERGFLSLVPTDDYDGIYNQAFYATIGYKF